jgi:DNA-binding helix-hairpin-helix protein with protein kinase domain
VSATIPGVLLAGDKMEYRLGPLLAEGGEGRVFRLQGRHDVLAKVYHEPAFHRDLKLELLIELGNKRLLNVAAWPLSRLRDATDETIGFVMESLVGWQPLHATYQIKSRLEQHPNRTWRHLVRIARNLATCVHHVHEAGLVIGDLNESNVLVSGESMVKLIDVDSFQCRTAGRLFACEVGKPELLPPELQGRSLEGLCRTENHDGFALAVLIFQILMFGRHPFAGRPEVDKEITLEESIEYGWYPYSSARTHPISAPKGLDIGWLAPQVRDLFERAFDPEQAVRPSAQEWYRCLKSFEESLGPCNSNQAHVYWEALQTCPWCALEEQWNLALFQPTYGSSLPSAFDASSIWAEIEQIPAPNKIVPPRPMESSDFLPAQGYYWSSGKWTTFIPLIIVMQTFLKSTLSFGLALGGLIVYGLIGEITRSRHKVPFNRARAKLRGLADIWSQTASADIFEAEKANLLRARTYLQNSGERLEIERRKLLREIYRRELDNYLSRYSIRSLEGTIGRETTDALINTFGFQTAADLREDLLNESSFQIPIEVRSVLTSWRDELDQRFWSTSSYRLTPHAERQATMMVAREDEQCRLALEQGPEHLRSLRDRLVATQIEIASAASEPTATLNRHGTYVAAFSARKR